MKILSILQNNWKKSIVFSASLGIAAEYGHAEYEKIKLIRRYCREVCKLGDLPISAVAHPRHVAVILNPAANKRKAEKEYEKFCAPLLHLAGLKVTLLVTNKNANATDIVSNIPANVNAVLIAGGDGTVSEVVTGLLRLKNTSFLADSLPIGILPVGRTNSLANALYGNVSVDENIKDKIKRFRVMMEATFSAVHETTTKLNVMEIKNIETDDGTESEKELKPIYAINRIHFGALRNVLSRAEKYWYFEKLRTYAVYLFGSVDRGSPVQGTLKSTPPCLGCSNCYLNRSDLVKRPPVSVENKRWWSSFVPRFNIGKSQHAYTDYSKIHNPLCKTETNISISSIDVSISSPFDEDLPALKIRIGPEHIGFWNFVKEGWSRVSRNIQYDDQASNYKEMKAQTLIFSPKSKSEREEYFSIDNEEFEMKKISVTLLSSCLSVLKVPLDNLRSC